MWGEGKIKSLDDPIETYVDGLKGTAYGAASIRDVLQMSSGTSFYEDYGKPGTNSAMTFSSAQQVLYRSWLLGEEMNDLLADFEKKEEPGTRFEYRSGDTHILPGWCRKYQASLSPIWSRNAFGSRSA